jgi:NADPH-dependent 2,4-dienoyl-CoA reductase/sulfur reductase-like enzyme
VRTEVDPLGEHDLLVVGGGPAGLAAAGLAARLGLRVALFDERPAPGGQIYRQLGPGFVVRDRSKLGRDYLRGQRLLEEARKAGATVLTGTSVLSVRGTSVVYWREASEGTAVTRAGRVLVAPGAYDRPVAFPGWTLPGVITAGGAQALLKAARVAAGERAAFAGSGPLALAFPAQLRHYGVNVVLVLDAGPPLRFRDALRLMAAAPGNFSLLGDGAYYSVQLALGRVPVRHRRIAVRAEGTGRVEALVHAEVGPDWRPLPGTEERVEVDTLCLGYGFVPSTELLRLAGCSFRYDEDLGGLVVEVDEWQRTSVEGVLAAGDGAGVRGALVAADQGRLAAIGAALDLGHLGHRQGLAQARPIRRRLAAKERFRLALAPLHSVGPGLYDLATPETVICRCEEVTLATLEAAAAASSDPNVVKSYTRAGMGLCQGRNCHLHIGHLLAAKGGVQPEQAAVTTARPPARPVPIGALADPSVPDEGLFVHA